MADFKRLLYWGFGIMLSGLIATALLGVAMFFLGDPEFIDVAVLSGLLAVPVSILTALAWSWAEQGEAESTQVNERSDSKSRRKEGLRIEVTAPTVWSGLVIEDVRRQGDITDVVLRNTGENTWGARGASIEDPHGNRTPLPETLSIATGGSEILRFHREEGEVFEAEAGEDVLLHTEDGQRTILWEDPKRRPER